MSVSSPRGHSSVPRARPRSPRVRARWRPCRGSRWRVAGAIWRPGPVGVMVRPPNSAQASTAAGKTVCRCPAGEGVVAQGVGPDLGLLYVPASGLPAGGAQGGVDGDGEAGGGGAVGVHRPFVRRACGGRGGGAWGQASVVGSTMRTPKWALRAVQARQGGGEAAVEGVAVLAYAAGGEFGVFEGFAGFAVGHGSAGGAFAAGGVGGGEVPGDEDGFGAAAGEAVALGAGEGVEEVLDEGVQGGGWSLRAAVPVRVAPRTEKGGGDGGQDAVAAVPEGGGGGVSVPLQSMRGSPARTSVPPVCKVFMIAFPPRACPRRTQGAKCRGWCGSWGGATRPGPGGV